MSLFDVDLPVIAAPMAGGPSTLDMLAAVSSAGGFGFLPAGYKDPDALAAMLAQARSLQMPFGVNVFVPSAAPMPVAEFRRYAELIEPEGIPYGIDLTAADPIFEDDHWSEKIEMLRADPVPVVSFTFGFPPPEVMRALHDVDSRIGITVTSEAEAAIATEVGADVLIVQASAAGGHSGTATPQRTPAAITLTELLRRIRQVTPLPLIAAGGLATAEHVRDALAVGAAAAMVGTALLRTDESGASEVHKNALVDPARTATVVTRAYTGRPARGLRTTFTDRFSDAAPVGYPEIHHLTRPLRVAAAAAGDADAVHLWAGTGHRHASTGSAGTVTAGLAGRL